MPHREILEMLAGGRREVTLHGFPGSYLALVLARLARADRFTSPLLVVTPDEDRARELVRDLGFFLGREEQAEGMDLPEVMYLPQVETSPYHEVSYDRSAVMQRMGVLFRLSQGYTGRVLVASAGSLRCRVLPLRAFVELCDLICAGEEQDRDGLAERLVACGFHRGQVVEDPGTFAVRGGILDLYPPLCLYPVRLEFYGDMVESIRLFDPGSQRTLRAVEEVFVFPVRETVATSGNRLREAVLAAADRVNHPSSRTRNLLEELEAGREFFGVEALTPAFHGELAPLSAYLPGDSPWVIMDPEGVQQALEGEDLRAAEGYQLRQDEGRITFPPRAFYVEAEELAASMEAHPRVLAAGQGGGGGAELRCKVADNADLVAELARARSQKGEVILNALGARLRGWQEQGRPVLISAGGVGHVDRLDALLRGHGVHAQVSRELGLPRLVQGGDEAGEGVTICPGELGRGFREPGGQVVLVETEIFGPKTRRGRPRRLAGPGLGDLKNLRDGDHVVHAEHGVARYRGLVKLQINGVPGDFLLLEFAGADRLYLPVYRMNQVQKFVGAEGGEPKLDRLGGVTWDKKRRKVRAEVRQLAEELLQLYAQRAALEGHAFAPGDAMFAEFEATFPFSETPDQERAIEDVLGDLTAARPMDRLVCGDVGFGKTEVALRAAFLAALDGKQVAVLAPTTVLVEQHVRTFTDRMGPYPLRVESLSRFRKPKEVQRVLADLARGAVDVVIGTHRLLSADVRFKDLGLLIIDEEQRFGVAHKERLKRLRTQVDVLTLTATPIPRTLQMTMVSMREVSVITTPPVDRLAIRTFVCRMDDAQVAAGIRKELDRGGQVFFVHNRVQTIDQWAARISQMVPEARVAVAHGQMDARKLERVMVDFVSGRHDVLVCTAIIESGLDIPRANTMFVNRADRFGLAQLYQLRGRIGRSRHRAFCYLLVPGFESMTPDARQRLAALQRFTELGSGFSIASHDLELRGAGDLLGARQSGQIAAVGFETYARILEQAVAELRGQPITRETDPEINSFIAAYIPEDHVEDTGQRLDLYRRLSQGATDGDVVAEILAEMRDRYGPSPPEVDALGELMLIRGLATRLGVAVVDLAQKRLSLAFGEETPLEPARVVELVSQRPRQLKLTPDSRLIHTFTAPQQAQPLEATKKILRELLALAA